MNKRANFLDSEDQHKLTEQECDLVALFRALNKSGKDILVRMIYEALMEDARQIKERSERT